MVNGPRVDLFDTSPSAAQVLADHLKIDHDVALEALRALVKAGWYLGPREPTNAMLVAYLEAVGRPPVKRDTILNALAKARKRWKAMALAATRAALSRRLTPPNAAAATSHHDVATGADNHATTGTDKGGAATGTDEAAPTPTAAPAAAAEPENDGGRYN